MAAPRFRLYVALSIDGYIATSDGGVTWLEAFTGDYDYEAFIASVATLVMGRTTFDQALGFGPWPYAGKDVYVLTSRPIARPPEGVVAWPWGIPKLVEQIRAAEAGDVWIVGGGRTLRGMIEAGALDEMELFVMPRLLGDGIRLFEPTPAFDSLQLVDTRAWNDGVVRLRYRKPGG